MHQYLRSIGLRTIRSRRELNSLINWVLEEPDEFCVAPVDRDDTLATVTRFFGGDAGVTVVGTLDETGKLQPEYCFPRLTTDVVSSEEPVEITKESALDGYIGMCDDFRLGMALIFSVSNVTDIAKAESVGFANDYTGHLLLSMFLSDATVLLPMSDDVPADGFNIREMERRNEAMMRDPDADPEAFQEYAEDAINRFERFMHRIQTSDILSVVDSFFMPHGVDNQCYYFLGRILSCEECFNELTGERFYRMDVESNTVMFTAVVNEADLTGIPQEGYRIRAHGWLQGFCKPVQEKKGRKH